MSTRHLVDPELLEYCDAFPKLDLTDEIIPELRGMLDSTLELGDAQAQRVRRKQVDLSDSVEGGQLAYLYLPEQRPETAIPGYIDFHGGGYLFGSPVQNDARNIAIASSLQVAVLAPLYRLAPEHPAPAALNDAVSALSWMYDNAADLGVDASRLGIGGDSAGGGLAVALALHNRDTAGIPVIHQQLIYPMIDDRTIAAADPALGEFIWTATLNQYAWSRYLGDNQPAAPVVPARAEDLSNLPPAWIATGALDLFLDENLQYARRLMRAENSVELQVYPGAMHNFPETQSALANRFLDDYLAALGRGLKVG